MKKPTRKTKASAASRKQPRKSGVKSSTVKKKSARTQKANASSAKKSLRAGNRGAANKGTSKKIAVSKRALAASKATAHQSLKGVQAPRQEQQEVSRHVTDISLNAGVSPVRESARRAAAVPASRNHIGARHH